MFPCPAALPLPETIKHTLVEKLEELFFASFMVDAVFLEVRLNVLCVETLMIRHQGHKHLWARILQTQFESSTQEVRFKFRREG
jgi:hypothetical protein